MLYLSPMDGLFIRHMFSNPWFFFSWSLIIVFSICVHEYAHARAAVARGDFSASDHLTLNPLIQMGPLSLAALLLLGFAWGSVPIQDKGSWRRTEQAWVAAIGPLSNLLLCALFGMLAATATRFLGQSPAAAFLFLAAQANGILFALNLLPAPMLDGWAVFALLIPAMEGWRQRYGSPLSWAVLVLLIATPLADFIWKAGAGIAALFLNGALRLWRL